MKELLSQQYAASLGGSYALPGLPKPRLREIQSPLTWVSCFLMYTATVTPDDKTRNLLTYSRLIIREAQHNTLHGQLNGYMHTIVLSHE